MQQGLKPGSKAARALQHVQQGTAMAVAHGAGVAAPEPPRPLSPSQAAKPAARRKEYIPRKGTANYAFLIVMFRGLKLGKLHYGKEELKQLAEASGLADKPIHGANAAASIHHGNVHEAYDGWSCFAVRPPRMPAHIASRLNCHGGYAHVVSTTSMSVKHRIASYHLCGVQQMCNRDPPLCQKFSSPGKYRLTPEGTTLAEHLFAFAVKSGEMDALAGVDHDAVCARYEGSQAEAAAAAAAKQPAKKRKKQAASAAAGDGDAVAAAAAPATAGHEAAVAASAPASQAAAASASGAAHASTQSPKRNAPAADPKPAKRKSAITRSCCTSAHLAITPNA